MISKNKRLYHFDGNEKSGDGSIRLVDSIFKKKRKRKGGIKIYYS